MAKKEEKKKEEVDKKKPGELGGMPPLDEVGKEVKSYMFAYEEHDKTNHNLEIARDALIEIMKKKKKFSIVTEDSTGQRKTLEFRESREGIIVKKTK